MASPEKFVGDLRSAVTDMTNAFQRAVDLCQFCQVMQWGESDFAGKIPGADLTPAQLMEAVATIGTLAQEYSAAALVLARLKA
jgi:hypothetical protein